MQVRALIDRWLSDIEVGPGAGEVHDGDRALGLHSAYGLPTSSRRAARSDTHAWPSSKAPGPACSQTCAATCLQRGHHGDRGTPAAAHHQGRRRATPTSHAAAESAAWRDCWPGGRPFKRVRRCCDDFVSLGIAALRRWTTADTEAESVWHREPQIIPGLLKTEDYAKAVMLGWHSMFMEPPREIGRRVEARRFSRTLEGAPNVPIA